MKTLKLMLAAATTVALLNINGGTALAQERQRPDRGDRGGFDPEQMRVRMMERYRESLEIKNDDEWKAIEPMIQKVSDARRNTMNFGFRGPGGTGGGRRGGEETTTTGGGGNRRGFGGEPNPDLEALQKSLEAKASAAEIKTRLAKYRESQKARQAALTAAQDELRKVLSVRQEATAVTLGLLQ